MVKLVSLRSSKRTKVLAWILPVYAVVFLFYAAFGTSENRRLRAASGGSGSDTWASNQASAAQQRHLLSVSAALPKNCTPAAIDEFPNDFFDQSQRSEGGVILHFLISIYLFYALAIICDDYFVPSLECLCNKMDMPTDIAGATFMAMGTSAPELFTSVIGAFVTEGDIGVGTIVGSAVFNILAVLSVCGLLAGIVVPLDWWPLTRDSLAYVITVLTLILIITDQRVTWWEGAIMLVLYALYIVMMFFNTRLENLAIRVVDACRGSRKRHVIVESLSSTEASPLLGGDDQCNGQNGVKIGNGTASATFVDDKEGRCQIHDNGYAVAIKDNGDDDDDDDDGDDIDSVWSMPYHGSFRQIMWVVMWPANFLFHLTIPNCRTKKWRPWYMGTFFMSILYIGSLSYVIAWMVTIIGYTLGVPDTVMGLTFLAAGTSVPEAISSVLVCRQGYGNMAVSNIIGSNIFDILFCLGLPWVIKASAFSSQNNNEVVINSAGIEYSSISLLSTVVFLYGAVIINKWKLDRRLGCSCLVMYIAFLVVSNLFELNVFGVVNLPTCKSH